ncbi:MAG: energy transducer TonB [Opitutales bacterium]|jgi:TonB family protein
MNSRIKACALAVFALIAVVGCSKKTDDKPADQVVATKQAASASQTQKAPQTPAAVLQTEEVNDYPRLEHYPSPIYPKLLQDKAIEGEVRMTMRVATDGRPEDVKVVSSTNIEFENSLLASMSGWQFKPAHKDGLPVARTVSIAIPYVINNRASGLPVYDNGQPELWGLVRPPHPGHGPASAIVRIGVSKVSLITSISIVSSSGQIDPESIINAVTQWAFFPSRSESGSGLPNMVLAQINFTSSGNVLVQYPFPAPEPAPPPAATK